MKTKMFYTLIVSVLFLSIDVFPQAYQGVQLNGNNISAYFGSSGIFNFNKPVLASGFEWPKSSNKYAIFTSGLCIGARINGQIAQSMASYTGEFAPGWVLNGTPFTSSVFKLYKISRGDNAGNNPDYANWGLMIPYGAPYIDVNFNQQYDPVIDSIGIRNAAQVVFICMTDGFASSHTTGEGFGGGITSSLLYSQVSRTAWCYDRDDLKNMQFVKWTIINKGTNPWNSTYLSIVCDPDLGDGNDDYIGCDTSKKLGYCYNADNNDTQYGANPPAVGFIMHSAPFALSSFTYFANTGSAPPPCESDPNGEPYPAYLMMKGLKKDSSNFMDPRSSPPVPTKFVYTGNPELNTGWTEYNGSVQNCGGNTGTIISVNPPGDRRFIMSSGAEYNTVNPGDTLTVSMSQLIARGTSNVNSVTRLKQYADTAWTVYYSGFLVGIKQVSAEVPSEFQLLQNYPNPFNPNTVIRYHIPSNSNVVLKVFDIMGREVKTLVNEKMQPGVYETSFDGSGLPSGVYFYRLTAGKFTETKKMTLLK